jgi:hypothetical protein
VANNAATPHSAILLINPPVSKPSEPPVGLAKLSGALTGKGVDHLVIDANLEAILFMLKRMDRPHHDTWTTRAVRHLSINLSELRSQKGYANFSRYSKAVSEINRLLAKGVSDRFWLSLADFSDHRLSPVRSSDLLYAAEHPEESPFFSYFRDRLASVLPALGRSPLIGFSLNYLSQALSTATFLGMVRQEVPSATILLGGGLVTSWMSSPEWHNPFTGLVDRLVAGPGENVLLSMAGKSQIACNSPKFSFDHFSLKDYLAPGPIIPYSASTGCYWRHCTFCPERSEGTSYSPISASQVATDLDAISQRYSPHLIHLVDNALSPALLKTLARSHVLVPWYGFSRFIPELCADDFCRSLRKSGCVMLKLGLESGDQAVLDSLSKGITLEMASRSLAALSRAGIATYVYLLFGTPAEDDKSARSTLDFVVGHGKTIDYLNLAIFNMPINSPDAAQVRTKGFYEGDLSLYTDFVHPHGWSRREVRRFLEDEFKHHPLIRPILLRQPPIFTSNHAPLFHLKEARDKADSS